MAKTKELLQDIRELLKQEEFSDEDLKKLWELKENFNENIEAIVEMMYSFAGLETEAKIIEENAKARKQFYKNQQERLKQAISFFMHSAGKDKLETGAVRISFRASESMVILDESKIPDSLKEQKIETVVMNDKIKARLKELKKTNEENMAKAKEEWKEEIEFICCDFARLEEKQNIQIK